jgi:hypothetical protein
MTAKSHPAVSFSERQRYYNVKLALPYQTLANLAIPVQILKLAESKYDINVPGTGNSGPPWLFRTAIMPSSGSAPNPT